MMNYILLITHLEQDDYGNILESVDNFHKDEFSRHPKFPFLYYSSHFPVW